MNPIRTAEAAVKEIISNDSGISAAARQIVCGLRELEQYRGMPAIGVKCTDVELSDDGMETATGFCEVVAVGELEAALTKSQDLAALVYELLRDYTVAGAELTQEIQGVEATGMRPIYGQVNNKYVVLTHVFWRVSI